MADQPIDTAPSGGVTGDKSGIRGRLPTDTQSTSQSSIDSGSDFPSQTSSLDESSLSSASQSAAHSQVQLPSVEDEYATQFFGFTPKSFCNGLYNAIDSFVVDSLDTLSEFLAQQFAEESVQAGCEAVRSKFLSNMDKAFDKLENYLESNLLCIPEHVLLCEDAAHAFCNPSQQEEGRVEGEINTLTNRVWALKYANAVLRDELRVVEAAQTQSDDILNRFLLIQNVLKENRVSDLREALRFTLNRAHRCLELMDKLKQLSAQTDSQLSYSNQDRLVACKEVSSELQGYCLMDEVVTEPENR